jgi:hypothetical protein
MKKTVLLFLATFFSACFDNRTFPEHQPYQPPQQQPLACLPDLDGRITAEEMVVAYGVVAHYLVSPAGEERAVDLAGKIDAQGRRYWDWGAEYASDQTMTVSPQPLSDQWFAGNFPGGQFVTPFDAGGSLQAVYSLNAGGFYFHGVASRQESPAGGKTLLAYQQPVLLYQLPLSVGQKRVAVGEVRNGYFQGLPYAGRDTYEVEVDAAGRLELTQFVFTQALRVRTRTTVEPAVGQSSSQRQVSFLFECYGEVARATSRLGEKEADFTVASEVRRLGL